MKKIATILLFLYVCSASRGQEWPNVDVLRRVVWLKVGDTYATGFTIEQSGTQFLVTARHVVKGLPAANATFEVRNGRNWQTVSGNLIFPDDKDVDIAVVRLRNDLTLRSDLPVGGAAGAYVGQQGYFLGFPYGLHSQVGEDVAAFVKHAILSAVVRNQQGSLFWYLDGFNNPGFSGGPLIFYDSGDRKSHVVGVISGFVPEQARKRVGEDYVSVDTLVNSGIVVAYPIGPALDAIHKAMK